VSSLFNLVLSRIQNILRNNIVFSAESFEQIAYPFRYRSSPAGNRPQQYNCEDSKTQNYQYQNNEGYPYHDHRNAENYPQYWIFRGDFYPYRAAYPPPALNHISRNFNAFPARRRILRKLRHINSPFMLCIKCQNNTDSSSFRWFDKLTMSGRTQNDKIKHF
jgi:hypothetical protein